MSIDPFKMKGKVMQVTQSKDNTKAFVHIMPDHQPEFETTQEPGAWKCQFRAGSFENRDVFIGAHVQVTLQLCITRNRGTRKKFGKEESYDFENVYILGHELKSLEKPVTASKG